MWSRHVFVFGLVLSFGTPKINAALTPMEKLLLAKNKATPTEGSAVTSSPTEKSLPEKNKPTPAGGSAVTLSPMEQLLAKRNKPTPAGGSVVTPSPTEENKPTPAGGSENSCQGDSGPGVCVKKTLCSTGSLTIDPATLFVPRSIGDDMAYTKTGTNCGWMLTCCPEKNVLGTSRTPKVVRSLGCGYSNPGGNIFRSTTDDYGFANSGDFPWMVALLTKTQDYIGGGTIIHKSVVMTAAHKVVNQNGKTKNPRDIVCRAGEYDTRTEDEAYPHQNRDVNKIVVHEGFNISYHHNNVALLFLESPFELGVSPAIDVACLEPNLPSPGTSCFTMGWGQDFANDKKYAVLLKKIRLDLVRVLTCQSKYRKTKLGTGYKLDKSLTCAGGVPGVDTCVGDGGSPLVCSIEGEDDIPRYSVVGMVSYGLTCGGDLPGVYVKIPQLYDWISAKIADEGLSKDFVY